MNEYIYNIKKLIKFFIKDIYWIFKDFNSYILELNRRKNNKYSNIIPDSILLKCLYKKKIGKNLNLKNPIELNEKLQWLKLNDRKEIYTYIVDKSTAKKYIESVVGEKYVIPTYGVWDRFEDIDFNELPNRFVFKCTHDSGSVILCKNKSCLDLNYVKEKLIWSLNRNFFWKYREWPYKNVVPRIICEEYLENKDGSQLVDYKFYCFGGKPRYFMYSIGETENSGINHKFNMELESIDYLFKKNPTINAEDIVLPSNINEMIEVVKKLCKGFQHIRVDLYNVNGKIYVGELTFYSGGGFLNIYSKEYENRLSKYIEIKS